MLSSHPQQVSPLFATFPITRLGAGMNYHHISASLTFNQELQTREARLRLWVMQSSDKYHWGFHGGLVVQDEQDGGHLINQFIRVQAGVRSKYALAGLNVGSHRNAGGQTQGEWKHSCVVIIPERTPPPPEIRCWENGERTSSSLLGNTSAKSFLSALWETESWRWWSRNLSSAVLRQGRAA